MTYIVDKATINWDQETRTGTFTSVEGWDLPLLFSNVKAVAHSNQVVYTWVRVKRDEEFYDLHIGDCTINSPRKSK